MIPDPGINGILPEVSLAATGILSLAIDLVLRQKKRYFSAGISLIGYIITSYFLFSRWGESGFCMNGLVKVSPMTAVFEMIFILSAVLTVILSMIYLEREGYHYSEFYGLLAFSILGMFIMSSAADLLVFFLGLELMSIALYIMVGLFRTRKESNEAAIKYLLLGAFATAFVIYGIALVFGITGTTNLAGIGKSLVSMSSGTTAGSTIILFGMLLLIVGFSFKLALVPFHMWTPDVYQGAPTALTGFMSVAVKGAAYAAFISVLTAFMNSAAQWSMLLQFLAIVTMTVGNVAALRQNNVKRMLAYSSIAHSGYILVGVVAYSKPEMSGIAVSAILFYLTGYMLMNIGAFAAAAVVAGEGDSRYNIEDYKGLSSRRPLLAAIIAIFMFSLIGIPPLVGFMAKFQVFYSALKADFIPLAIIGVLNSVVSVYYYLRVVLMMYMEKPDERTTEWIKPKLAEYAVLLLLALGVVILGLFPSVVMEVFTSSIKG